MSAIARCTVKFVNIFARRQHVFDIAQCEPWTPF